MERLNLIKYGFVRKAEDDFSDDGNRFTCYRVGRVSISKLLAYGELYLSGSINDGTLCYDDYTKLPHYICMDRLNGVSTSSITKEDIQKFYEDCKAYEAEYTKAEAEIVTPTYEELLEAYRKIRDVRIKEYNEILSMVTVPLVCNLEDYNLKHFIDYFNTLKHAAELNIEDAARRNLGTAYSRSKVNPKQLEDDCLPCFYYKELLELIKG